MADGADGGAAGRGGSFTLFGQRVAAERVDPGLHVVATPIGNLGDVSLRALRTLAASDAVLAEDTRVTRTLLSHYGIATPLTPYHEHNAATLRPRILERLRGGATLALVSDAGTPLVSDPGFKLVADACAEGLTVTAVPGASAVLAALVTAGLPTDRFFFEGFLPPKGAARRARAAELAGVPGTLVIFESPRRVADALADLAATLGGDRPAAVARELTKKFETVRRGPLGDLARLFAAEDPPRGEMVILVGAAAAGTPSVDADEVDARLRACLDHLSVKDSASAVAAETGLPRRQVYARALALAADRTGP